MKKIKDQSDFLAALNSINPTISILSPFYKLSTKKVKCHCNTCGFEWETYPYILLDGHGCKYCNKKPKGQFKFNIGDIITTNGRNLLIVDREYREWFNSKTSSVSNRKYYKYRCVDCGNEDWIIECRLSDKLKDGCNVCKSIPNHLVVGINDIATVLPNIASLFKNYDEAKNNVRGSHNRAIFICPDCGREFNKRIDTVCANGLSCPCNDKWSYPNKFIYSLLEQSNAVFIPEKTFDWSNKRRYDEYVIIGDKSVLIEIQGVQHYEKPIVKGAKHRSVEEEKENDLFKYNLAIQNGIDYYFTIDCRESNMEYIKHSIISSGLLDILSFDSSNIDWNKCDEFATSNFIKQICSYYATNEKSVEDVAKYFKLSKKTIQRYLNKGNRFGWCHYNGRENSLNNLKRYRKTKGAIK